MRAFHEESDVSRKRAFVELLEIMAKRYDHAGSKAVMSALADDLARMEQECTAELV